MKAEELFYDLAIGGVNHSLVGNGGPDCVNYIPFWQRSVETIFLSLLAFYGIYISMENLDYSEKSEPPLENPDEDLQKLYKKSIKNDELEKSQISPITRICVALNFKKEYINQALDRNKVFNFYFAIFVVEIAYKIATKTGIFLLNPCHLTTLFQLILLKAPSQSPWAVQLFRFQLYTVPGAVIALLFPILNTRLVYLTNHTNIFFFQLTGEVVIYFIQHILIVIIPVYQMSIKDSYAPEPLSNIHWPIFGISVSILYHFIILQPVSLATHVNLNCILCPAISDPFKGRFYRIFACIHQSILVPVVTKLYEMDYLLNSYFFNYLPFGVSEEWKKLITTKAVEIVMWADWLCKFQDPKKFYENHTSFFASEIIFLFLCLLTFIHAFRHGNRYLFAWIGILIHSLNVENLCYWIPDLNSFWQAQGILTLFGMRAPISVIFGVYHVLIYISYVFVKRMYLPWWAEGPAVGLGAVMLDIPYDMMGIKLLWWTWHDTDPNIFDRMYWVPWNSYYFHASFACSFVWILHLTQKIFLNEYYDWKKFAREFLCCFLAGTLAFWVGTIQFALFYHPAHDIFGIHAEITTIILLAFYALIVYIADRRNQNSEAHSGNPYFFDELSLAVCVHYMFFMILVLIVDPKNIVSEGLHQPIGDCNSTQTVQTATGMVLSKKTYLCPESYDEKYFDFHCIPGGRAPKQRDENPLEWYAICGTPFENRAEYILIIWSICIIFSCIFYQAASRSGRTPKIHQLIYRKAQLRKDFKEAKEPLMKTQSESTSKILGAAKAPKAKKQQASSKKIN